VANLAIAKSHVPTPPVPGTGITYTIRVTNNGPEPVASVVVADSVAPAGAILGLLQRRTADDSGSGVWIFSSPLLAGQYAT
jgi:uncharacterized repeat protein (TIGR01451 family)